MSEPYNALDHIRDTALAQCDRPEDARRGAGLLREVAFARWCPACQDGEHWNHQRREYSLLEGVMPGECRSIENLSKQECTCPVRP